MNSRLKEICIPLFFPQLKNLETKFHHIPSACENKSFSCGKNWGGKDKNKMQFRIASSMMRNVNAGKRGMHLCPGWWNGFLSFLQSVMICVHNMFRNLFTFSKLLWKTWARYIPQLFDIGKNRPQSTSEATHSTPGIAIRRQSFGAIADCRDCRLKGMDGFVTLNVTWLVGDYSCYYRSIVTILSRYLLEIGKNQVTVNMEQIFFCEVLLSTNRENTSNTASRSIYLLPHHWFNGIQRTKLRTDISYMHSVFSLSWYHKYSETKH